MVDLLKTQKEVYTNKINHNFNVKDVNLEFCLLHEEVSEAFRAYRKKLPDLGEELADIAIYLLGIAEILKIDLGKEIENKMEKNKKRIYQNNGDVLIRIE